ncbi:DUF1963 domain-containing protein [Mesorhizobium sp. WSM4303]|uniref:DUF1963 domain-containing protein n=1 Tax=unclassified Mesorhizobium TaxID=325217 RepID=UPI00115DCA8F|nr:MULTISPECIES: DUF1963 domain-containing protein [unclassified Mesorhizobium]TRC89631.1 DUF1963 domain-containing protein [Mesorhizobium sp. WSM4306]TRC96178.1 DUF1963 domain-containing protein [Mesorhizobium sp. WSM4303]
MFLEFGKREPVQPHDAHVSVVLRRKVPVASNDTSLSWLGGLPRMPASVKWPRDKDKSPLHFIAQIHCTDLPADLWGGNGPRTGWLLLFVHAEKLEDEARGGTVKVLHVDELGPEMLPPRNIDTLRNEFRERRTGRKHQAHPRETKAWRKWPVEVVVQRYGRSAIDWEHEGPIATAAELYGAPDCDRSLASPGAIGLDRPLTWGGALDVIEALISDLNPATFAERFTGSCGLDGPPEPDQDRFNDELRRRLDKRLESFDYSPGYGFRLGAIRMEVIEQLKSERRTGWIERSFRVLEAKEREWGAKRANNLAELQAARAAGDAETVRRCEGWIEYYDVTVRELEEHRTYLTELFAPYQGPDGEAAFTAQIEASAAAHLAWGARQGEALLHWHKYLLAKVPGERLPESGWNDLAAALGASRSEYWAWSPQTDVLRKRAVTLDYRRHLDTVTRGEVLDVYARGEIEQSGLSPEQIDDLTRRLRHFIDGRAHRMGGHRNPVQTENLFDDDLLLFQITSDDALDWVWADLGALYVTIEERALRRNDFSKVHAWLEGG